MSEESKLPMFLSEDPSNKPNKQELAMPVEVSIMTPDYEIQGIVYVSRKARADRRISDLLNDPKRRFLAVTDAKLISREGPSSVRHYSFLQLHIDNIQMIHPSIQTVARNTGYSMDEAQRFETFRTKLNRAAI